MQYDDGSGDVQPGHDIAISGNGSSEDLGPATYDSDHDGVADSVVIGQDDHSYVVTDSDHDGRADSMRAFDEDGRRVDPKTGEPLPDDTAGQQTGTDGHDDTASSHGSDGTAGGHGGDGSAGDAAGAIHTSDTGADAAGQAGAGAPDAADGTTGTGTDAAAGGLSVAGADGGAIELGDPTVDLDKDGHADTAVVRGTDGSVTGFTDRDGDGVADQITQINPDHQVVIAVSDGQGGWQVVATGHMDADNTMVEDPTPAPGAEIHLPTGEAGTSGTDGTDAPDAGVPTDTTDTTTDTTTVPATDGPATGGPTPDAGTDPGGASPAGDITYSAGGHEYDLGAPTHDMNADGTPDTVVVHQADGTVIGYTDTDGDGQADQITQVAADGSVVIGVSDGHGGWSQVASGHRADDGSFVADQPAPAASAG
ncbi:DUF6802 family protein [Nakamurella endophytica]|uniref:DUF6802 domain-containing protein n=1 Tax=Nakamurella endophytica TaxID=1748367 RepID=A0A917SS88_9ACTN|nr:DUF6802 family protein [Nakamurella endophytica]GGL96146.1 hypothetical protein GCM10011594_14830 [Nakamurella endophytica]